MRSGRAVGALLALLLSLLAIPGVATAQNQNGSGAQSNAQAPQIEAEPAEPELEPGVEPQASLPDIEDEVNCVVCGVTLDRATEAPQALQQRELIRELIAQGLTKDEIKDQLVAEYGEDVLATPATSGFDLFAWLVPGVVVIVAAIGIVVGLRRWRSNGPGGGPGGDGGSDGPGPAIADTDRKRLDEDIERYGI
ncbi:cytochrome c-type biogenesis protein CcmH [Thermoleophilia bacterium SCSIO 60948]|nr:cytochrome c-type biogenesis protein CcmH [Thermoleophilia bacterium SCSIO 60948]